MRAFLSLFTAGLVTNLALPPFFILPILFWTIPLLYKNSSFYSGLFWGFGYFIGGLYWVYNPLTIFGDRFLWAIPLVTIIIPLILSLYIAIACYLHNKFKSNNKAISIVIFAICFVFMEIARGYLFTGFPWNLIGYSLNISIYSMQSAVIFGAYGQSFLLILLTLLPLLLKDYFKRTVILLSMIIALIAIFAVKHVNHNQQPYKELSVKIVQPNILQRDKWQKNKINDNFTKLINITSANLADELIFGKKENQPVDLIILPEVSTPLFYLQRDKNIRQIMAQTLLGKGVMLTGAERFTFSEQEGRQVYNSIFAIDSNANIIDYYDKRHLVPFGEYVPLQEYLPFLSQIIGGISISKGQGKNIMNIGDLKILPLICYEIIFPDYSRYDADILVNSTNDAWFGDTIQPYQHFEMTRLRAVEAETLLLRSNNTGISAIIDHNGKIINKTPIYENALIIQDIKLYPKSNYVISYKKYGLWNLLALKLFFLLLLLVSYRKVKIEG